MALHVSLGLRLKDFQLQVKHSFSCDKVTAIVGASGSGKTSLLRCILGLHKKYVGEVKFSDALNIGQPNFIATHKRGIAYVSQDAFLFPHLKVEDQLLFAEKRSAKQKMHFKKAELINILGLQSLLARKPHELSGGQKQLVAISCALLSQPRLLLLDEPVSALDRGNRILVLNQLLQVKQKFGLGMLIVSHYPEELLELADSLVYMQNGNLVFSDSFVNALTQIEYPLAQAEDAFSIIDCESGFFDEKLGLSLFKMGNLSLRLPGNRQKHEASSLYRFRVLAKDVSIALEAPHSSSILNILPASIEDTRSLGEGQALVRASVAGQYLLARISEYSLSHLGLQPGKSVYLQIKALALLN